MMLFSADDLARLRRPHVARAWLLEMDLPAGISRLHNGVGRKMVGGHEWRGVSDPLVGQLVGMTSVEDPRFGTASAVTVTLSGANAAFFKSVHDDARQIEGRRADLYFIVVDQETEEILIGLRKVFPGKMTAPLLQRSGVGTRSVSITIESFWSGQNFPFGGKWNGADQRKRYPGDLGLDLVGVKAPESWL